MSKHLMGIGALTAGALLIVATSARLAAGDGDAENGKVLFDMCASCHTLDGSESDGPTLQGVVGRKAGGLDGYRYSAAMARSEIVWDAMTLDKFLTDPQVAVPGNKMAFAGMDDASGRSDVIAYLTQATKK